MYASHSAHGALKALGAFAVPVSQAVLDSAAEAKKQAEDEKKSAFLDAAGSYAATEIRDAAVAAIREWATTDAADLDEDESMADRALAFAVGIADENMDGEIGDDEASVINVALNAMADYAIGQGASEEDVVALFNDGDNAAALRVAELLAAGSGDDSDVDSFVFDGESSEAVLDSILADIDTGDAILDATYKKKLVIRKGKKVRINKRVSGHVRLSAGQKVAIKKAGLKSRSSSARVKRLKSMKVRAKTIG